LTRVKSPGVTSGQPSRSHESGHQAIMVKDQTPGQSLFCFSLMLPGSYEQGLLAWQYVAGLSIFACDEYAVYSNKSEKVAPGVNSSIVKSDLKCKFGGEFKTALNTEIFMEVWSKLVGDGRYRFHDWTVKVDPDAVFFPARLRGSVQHIPEKPEGVYLNNCRRGMHGPFEVFSRNAVRAWARGSISCVRHFTRLCSGPCLWGEDMFIDQCLSKVLHVSRVDQFTLLIEDHCDPPTNWDDCRNPAAAAFHPFKTLSGYRGCANRAQQV